MAAAAFIVVLSFALSAFLYPALPDSMASHWNIRGQVDGYMQKAYAAFLIPGIILLMALLFFAIPRIDPLKENIVKFRKHYDGFIIIICAFMFFIHLQVLLWGMGIRISPSVTLPLGIGVLFYYIGILVEKAKRNWFIGIRTPWTLSSDSVWEKTHSLGGRLFKAAGIIALFGALVPAFAFYLIVVPILSVAFYTTVYSYLEYRKEARHGKVPAIPAAMPAGVETPLGEKEKKPARKKAKRTARKKRAVRKRKARAGRKGRKR